MNYPKGYLIAIGGAEDRGEEIDPDESHKLDFFEEGILKNILTLASKKGSPCIEIVTAASSIPEEMASGYKKAFKTLGCLNVNHIKIAKREDAENKKTLERIKKCNCLLFSGGDQLRLCSLIGGTEFHDTMLERYQNEAFVIAGTSAGAAAMSNFMIGGGRIEKSYLKGEVHLSMGLGLLQGVIIDTHFDRRGRFARLVQAIAAQPSTVGLGLGEDSGVIVEKGHLLRAIGSGSVVVIDGSYIGYNNIAAINNGKPLSIEGLHVHVMANQDLYDLNDYTFTGVD